MCPHSAIGLCAALNYQRKEQRSEDLVVIATATPAKFPEVVEKAGLPVPSFPAFAELHSKAETKFFMEKDDDWEQILRVAIVEAMSGQ